MSRTPPRRIPGPIPGTHCPSRERPSRTHRAGFSLIELVIVATILSIAAAVAVPRFTGASVRQRLAAAEQRVLADIAAARQEARALSRTITIEFHISQERYVTKNAAEFRRVYLTDEPYRVAIDSVTGLTDRTLTIDPHGETSETMTLVLSAGGETRTIVEPATVATPSTTSIVGGVLDGVLDLLGN